MISRSSRLGNPDATIDLLFGGYINIRAYRIPVLRLPLCNGSWCDHRALKFGLRLRPEPSAVLETIEADSLLANKVDVS
jgi:hypothetical protein